MKRRAGASIALCSLGVGAVLTSGVLDWIGDRGMEGGAVVSPTSLYEVSIISSPMTCSLWRLGDSQCTHRLGAVVPIRVLSALILFTGIVILAIAGMAPGARSSALLWCAAGLLGMLVLLQLLLLSRLKLLLGPVAGTSIQIGWLVAVVGDALVALGLLLAGGKGLLEGAPRGKGLQELREQPRSGPQ